MKAAILRAKLPEALLPFPLLAADGSRKRITKKPGAEPEKRAGRNFSSYMLLWRDEETKKAAAETARYVGKMGYIACAKGFNQLVAEIQR